MEAPELPKEVGGRVNLNPFDFFSELLRVQSDLVIHMVLYFDGAVDIPKMQSAVKDAVTLEPVCNCRLVESEDTLWWEPLPPVNPGDCFCVFENKGPDHTLAQALLDTIDPFSGPQIKVFLIRPDDEKGDVLVINASHVAMDGRGLKDMSRLIIDLYRQSTEGPSFIKSKVSVKDRNLPLISTLLPPGTRSALPDEFSKCPDRWTFPSKSSEIDCPAFVIMTIPGPRVASINAKRKELGVTLNDLLLAVVAMACSNLDTRSSSPEYSFLTTIDLRRYYPVPGRSVTNYSTAFEVSIPLKPTDRLSSVCRTVNEIMKNKKNDFPGIKDALDAELLWKSGLTAARETIMARASDPGNFESRIPIFSNTGIIKLEVFNHQTPRILNAYILPCIAPPPVIFIAVSTYGNTMTLSMSYQWPAVADEQVRSLFGWIDRLLPGYSCTDGQETEPGTPVTRYSRYS
jgi:NRPS condensation-like uncharacterized protein